MVLSLITGPYCSCLLRFNSFFQLLAQFFDLTTTLLPQPFGPRRHKPRVRILSTEPHSFIDFKWFYRTSELNGLRNGLIFINHPNGRASYPGSLIVEIECYTIRFNQLIDVFCLCKILRAVIIAIKIKWLCCRELDTDSFIICYSYIFVICSQTTILRY